MKKKEESVERRMHKRYGVVPHLLASFNPDLAVVGKIINISLGGLEFRYTGCDQTAQDLSTLNISMTDGSFFFLEIPYRPIWNCAVSGAFCEGSVAHRSGGVAFRSLTDAQRTELRYVLQYYTLDEPGVPSADQNSEAARV